MLWSLRTTPNRSTGFTPFFLVYGAEAILPTNIQFDAPRKQLYTEQEAKEAREDNVDLLEEARELALSRSAIYQQDLCHTTPAGSGPPLSARETWCCAWSRAPKECINCPHHGKAHSSSAGRSRTIHTI